MPNWKKIITSGSDATLNSLNVTSGVTGSLFGTASYATQALTASFATTSSFSNTTKVNSATLTFFHNQVTDTTGSRVSYIGGFAAPPYNNAGRIALHVPFNGTITHCVVSSFASTPAASPTTTLTCALSVDGGSTYPVNLGTVLISQFIDDSITILNTAVTAGDKVNIRLTESTSSNAVWGVNAVLVIKSN